MFNSLLPPGQWPVPSLPSLPPQQQETPVPSWSPPTPAVQLSNPLRATSLAAYAMTCDSSAPPVFAGAMPVTQDDCLQTFAGLGVAVPASGSYTPATDCNNSSNGGGGCSGFAAPCGSSTAPVSNSSYDVLSAPLSSGDMPSTSSAGGDGAHLLPSHPLTSDPSLSLPPLAPYWTNEEEEGADIDAPLCGGLAEEDEAETVQKDAVPALSSSQRKESHRLHLHPLAAAVAAATSGAYPATALVTDPITAALTRQKWQISRGEPRSPLSPHTLQALCAASVDGRHAGFLSKLTADDVLAPLPLALTWYPSAPRGVTKFAERKRTCGGVAVTARQQHEESMLEEEEEGVGGVGCVGSSADALQPPLYRTRSEGGAEVPQALESASAPSSSSAVSSTWSHCSGSSVPTTESDTATPHITRYTAAAAELQSGAPPAQQGLPPSYKREREDCVYEYLSHERQLR